MRHLHLLLSLFLIAPLAVVAQTSEGVDDQNGTKPTQVNIGGREDNSNSDLDHAAIAHEDQSTTAGDNTSEVNGNFRNQGVQEGVLLDEKAFEDLKRNLRIYPNPAVNFLSVDLGTETFIELSLTNMLGSEVFRLEGKVAETRINLGDYPSGPYFLHIRAGSHMLVKRIEVAKR